MKDPRFRTLDAGDIYEMIHTEIYRVLETTYEPALYKKGRIRLDIRTRDGACIVPDRTIPDNWQDVVFALSALNIVTGATEWTRVVRRDDGEVFAIKLDYSAAGEVEYVD